MDISNILTLHPTKTECNLLSNKDKLWIEFDFFYENGDSHSFIGDSGNRITFGVNGKEKAWNLIVNFKVVMTSIDAEEIISKSLEYY